MQAIKPVQWRANMTGHRLLLDNAAKKNKSLFSLFSTNIEAAAPPRVILLHHFHMSSLLLLGALHEAATLASVHEKRRRGGPLSEIKRECKTLSLVCVNRRHHECQLCGFSLFSPLFFFLVRKKRFDRHLAASKVAQRHDYA